MKAMDAKTLGSMCAYPTNVDAGDPGLTIRQQFAMAAMQGMAARTSTMFCSEVAELSVSLADALLFELAKETQE